jgi:hypothetical protein
MIPKDHALSQVKVKNYMDSFFIYAALDSAHLIEVVLS